MYITLIYITMYVYIFFTINKTKIRMNKLDA